MALTLLLASKSPRRSDLLTRAAIPFRTVEPDITERADVHLTLGELTSWNALRKGMVVARAHPQEVVLAADTLVALEGELIGKPVDFTEAARFLRKLSGNVHQVCSSVFIAHLAEARMIVFQEVTSVRFKRLSEAHIHDYFKRVNPLDKAGAYAAQGHGSEIIAEIRGSYSNVVGLPMERTLTTLASFGIRPALA